MTEPIHAVIQKDIKDNDIVLYMKGTPKLPMCGFSSVVAQILEHLKAPYKSVNVMEDPDVREGIKTFSDWPTIPQLYVKGEFIGGCDIIREMYESGELEELYQEKGIDIKRARD
ncbi:MAG: Grx4 family monothiol glutaredoxin [Alphaproteobacteria bacterium]|jgi:monothiol glutaredoxin|nr:Grx4 family monothiol glutaredoxin [Alphaproteobacteria bacterium]MBT5390312.1 Grx4 family monothiol glutaredoxin [Alphaproteobacteria bacterium]MBT5540288.1 Grx4 family monothiol glutaredoxin [Alphaproteobacteria bacterium]MBT5654598.1 Grx4 family monothiol glutaredoxin [Alphaproteobacteria bacterium]